MGWMGWQRSAGRSASEQAACPDLSATSARPLHVITVLASQREGSARSKTGVIICQRLRYRFQIIGLNNFVTHRRRQNHLTARLLQG